MSTVYARFLGSPVPRTPPVQVCARLDVSPFWWRVLGLGPRSLALPSTPLAPGSRSRLELDLGDGITISLPVVAGPVERGRTQRFWPSDPDGAALLGLAVAVSPPILESVA